MADPTRCYVGTLPTLPSGASGFLAPRADRPGHIALYRACGALLVTFATGASEDTAASLIVAAYPDARIDGAAVYGLPA